MLIKGQCLQDAPLPHQHEGNAICQGPVLVHALPVQIQAGTKQIRRGGDNFHHRLRVEVVHQRECLGPVGWLGEEVDGLPKNLLGDHK